MAAFFIVHDMFKFWDTFNKSIRTFERLKNDQDVQVISKVPRHEQHEKINLLLPSCSFACYRGLQWHEGR